MRKSFYSFVIALIALISTVPEKGISQEINSDEFGSSEVEHYPRPIVADNYLIRPGEVLRISFVNTDLADLRLTVDAEGRIVHREVGVHNVSGLSLTQVREQLLETFSELYPGSQVVISVGSPRVVSIQVSGAVANPGRYRAYTSQTVSDIIDSAGGLTGRATRRTIQFSGGPVTLLVDLDQSTYAGDTDSNPLLYAGENLFIPERIESNVTIIGYVHAPRSIELMQGDDLAKLISLSGGAERVADVASSYVVGDSTRELSSSGSIHSGDIIMVPSNQSDAYQALKLAGGIAAPGMFSFESGMTLGKLLAKGGGAEASADLRRITVFRLAKNDAWMSRENGRYPITTHGAMEIQLWPGDSVVVPLSYGFVRVSGDVRRPGLYVFSEGKDLSHYIKLAGGIVSGIDKPIFSLFDKVSSVTNTVGDGTIVFDGDEILVGEANKE